MLDDALWLGRPVELDSDQIETFVENSQCYTTWEIAAILKIYKSIKLWVKMENVSFILWKNPYGLCCQLNKSKDVTLPNKIRCLD